MKKILTSIVLGAMTVALSGCIVVGVTRKNQTLPEEQPVVVVQATPDSVAYAEIDAAAKLDFDNSRLSALNNIAARSPLSTAAQVHLINRAFQRLDFDNSKMTVLQTLIRNPSFSNTAKQTILVNLNRLSFDNQRSALLAAINERGELKD